jgi:hypothetical protein
MDGQIRCKSCHPRATNAATIDSEAPTYAIFLLLCFRHKPSIMKFHIPNDFSIHSFCFRFKFSCNAIIHTLLFSRTPTIQWGNKNLASAFSLTRTPVGIRQGHVATRRRHFTEKTAEAEEWSAACFWIGILQRNIEEHRCASRLDWQPFGAPRTAFVFAYPRRLRGASSSILICRIFPCITLCSA